MTDTKILKMNLGERSYDITVGRGILADADKYINLSRKVFIVTDDGVPESYSRTVAAKCREARIYTVARGEGSKSMETLGEVLSAMLDFEMTRADLAIAVGGGVVGDLTGFAASVYMRGIDFCNIPTTLLSQVDSSIGGKTAVNLDGVKNIIGAFHQPKAVIIDTDTLKTLPARHVSAGLAEAVKMSVTSDAALFSVFENEDINESNIADIIVRSLKIKKAVVEEDERESGLRKILNFGHTFGHGIEAEEEMHGLYHGECVALGMIPMCAENVQKRLIKVLKKLSLPTEYQGDVEKALSYVIHDKKCKSGSVEAIFSDEVGSCRIEKMTVSDFSELVKRSINA